MFLCEDCHDNDYCLHGFRSYGPCENCGKTAVCYDCGLRSLKPMGKVFYKTKPKSRKSKPRKST